MAVTASVQITGTVSGGLTGTKQLAPASITNSASVESVTQTTLSSGANTISIPSGAVGCIIVPPAGNAIAITLKGVAGDTGIAMHLTNAACLSFPSGTASFVINAASAFSSPMVFNWF